MCAAAFKTNGWMAFDSPVSAADLCTDLASRVSDLAIGPWPYVEPETNWGKRRDDRFRFYFPGSPRFSGTVISTERGARIVLRPRPFGSPLFEVIVYGVTMVNAVFGLVLYPDRFGPWLTLVIIAVVLITIPKQLTLRRKLREEVERFFAEEFGATVSKA